MTEIKTKHNRRSFLKASTLAGGGMLLSFSWLAACKDVSTSTAEEAATLVLPENWFDLNAFLKIGENGVVTIMSPNPEIGQNVKTSMPMIVAEELDVDWSKVVVEQAPYDGVKYSRQIAGGSQSIRKGWDSLRMAGATARRMLLEAAAKKLEVPVAELTTKAGMISHTGSDKKVSYGEVANMAGGMEVPEKIELKDPKDFTIIGQSQKNVDAKKIITGTPLFGLDIQREGMQIAMIVHPPAFGMKLKSANLDAIKSMPGITHAITINSVPEGYKKIWSDVNAFPELVAIVGKTTWEVMQAKKAVKAEWTNDSKLESSTDHETALTESLAAKVEEPSRRDGDPEAAFAKAAKVIEQTYHAPFLAHNTMEPMNFFAHVTADKAELEGPIQTPQFLNETLVSVLGMPKEKISIMMTRMGGGFGRRLYGHFGVEAALISKAVNAPVKLVYTREDDMTQGTYRPAYKVTYKAALDDNNELTAVHIKGTGISESPVFEHRFPAGAVANYLVEENSVESNISTGAWRAPRSNFMAGAESCFLDEVAEAIGKDPIDFRLELLAKAKSNPVGEKNDYDAARYAGVLELVKDRSGWGTDRKGVFRGVSAYFCHNSYVAQVVDIVMKDNKPKVQKVWCAVDCGIVVNPDAARNQIEGGIVDGIGHAMYSAITFKDGQPQENNFNQYQLIRHHQAPESIETFFVDNGISPTGLGEPSLPPIMAALANALAKATGERVYRQPFVSEQEILG